MTKRTWIDGLKSALAIELFLKYSKTELADPWNYQPMDEKLKWIKDAEKMVEHLQEQGYISNG